VGFFLTLASHMPAGTGYGVSMHSLAGHARNLVSPQSSHPLAAQHLRSEKERWSSALAEFAVIGRGGRKGQTSSLEMECSTDQLGRWSVGPPHQTTATKGRRDQTTRSRGIQGCVFMQPPNKATVYRRLRPEGRSHELHIVLGCSALYQWPPENHGLDWRRLAFASSSKYLKT
jgi:hypothetical protein